MSQSTRHPGAGPESTRTGDFPSAIGIRNRRSAGTGQMPSGIIQRYFEDIKMGTLQGIDLQSYSFKRADWISASEPKTGMKVTFELDKNRPVNIRVEE